MPHPTFTDDLKAVVYWPQTIMDRWKTLQNSAKFPAFKKMNQAKFYPLVIGAGLVANFAVQYGDEYFGAVPGLVLAYMGAGVGTVAGDKVADYLIKRAAAKQSGGSSTTDDAAVFALSKGQFGPLSNAPLAPRYRQLQPHTPLPRYPFARQYAMHTANELMRY